MPKICIDDKKFSDLLDSQCYLKTCVTYHLSRSFWDQFADMDYHRVKAKDCEKEITELEKEMSSLFVPYSKWPAVCWL